MLSRKKLFATFFIILLVVQSALKMPFAYSQTPSITSAPSANSDNQAGKLQSKIQEYQTKIADLRGQGKTLSSQIQVMDSQISLTELRIEQNKEQTDTLTKDIANANKRISRLEGSTEDVTKVLINRIRRTYEVGDVQILQITMSSSSISDAFRKLQYLKLVQSHDKKLLYNTIQAKNDYANQKNIFEDKKKKVDELQKQLDSYTTDLAKQKQDKESLLKITKNSEAEYQNRLAEVLRELQQSQKAASILVSTEPRHVSRGDTIGLMGSTGHSTGAHLHFGVYGITSLDQYSYYSNYENPANYLSSTNIDWQTGCSGDSNGQSTTGSGSFAWPMATGDLHISQGFGNTCYTGALYGGRPHPALDMYNNTNIAIKAVDDGQAYFCRNCTGDGANGVFLFHSNGKMSLYWHLQ